MKSITHQLDLAGGSLVVIPPAGAHVPAVFRNVRTDLAFRSRLICRMQRFRGGEYLRDNAILPEELTPDGRHFQESDERGWHVLTLGRRGAVLACLRFVEAEPTANFDALWLRHSALAESAVWGETLRTAVTREMRRAAHEGIRFGEVGGWAIAPERRLTMEPLGVVLATYGLLGLLGGCAGFATATRRHHSSSILRKIGLAPLFVDGSELPPYYDPQYRCEMEMLRFDSREPNPRFRDWVAELSGRLAAAPVIVGALGEAPAPARDFRLSLWAGLNPALAASVS